jgi:hypothetical protein
MKRSSPYIATLFVPISFFLAMVTPSPSLAQGSDNGQLHRSDPCSHTPDTANGVQRNCRFGASSGVVKGDFNGDGIADLAIGVPNELRVNRVFSGDLNTGFIATDEPGAGAINIFFGSASGVLGTNGTQVLDQTSLLVSQNAHFGTAMAAGKFKSVTATVSDLAVGVPGVAKPDRAGLPGAVYIYNNKGNGISSTERPQVFFAADITNLPPVLSFGVAFPSNMSMTWGDFNGDGLGDLAVEVRSGCSNENCISGAVIYFGSATGLSASRHQAYDLDDGFSPNNFLPPTGCPTNDFVGSGAHFCAKARGHVSLAASDLDGDGRDELLIGAPGCNMITDSGSTLIFALGCVAIIPGKSPQPDKFFGWSVITGDELKGFGASITVGDFDGDGFKDVVVGQPGTAPQFTTVSSGSVRVYSHIQLSRVFDPIKSSDSTLLNQDTTGIGGTQNNAKWGASLAANDFNGDGVTDLAVGAPAETVNGIAGSGQVNVIYGLSGTGLSTAASTNHPAAQTILGDPGSAAGTSLTAWNFGKTAQPDLVVGQPFADVDVIIRTLVGNIVFFTIDGAGTARAFYGSTTSGLNVNTEQRLNQNQVSGDSAKSGNHFGASAY